MIFSGCLFLDFIPALALIENSEDLFCAAIFPGLRVDFYLRPFDLDLPDYYLLPGLPSLQRSPDWF